MSSHASAHRTDASTVSAIPKQLFPPDSKSLVRNTNRYFCIESSCSPFSGISLSEPQIFNVTPVCGVPFACSFWFLLFSERREMYQNFFHLSSVVSCFWRFSNSYRDILALGVVLPQSKHTPNGPRSLGHRPKQWLKSTMISSARKYSTRL